MEFLSLENIIAFENVTRSSYREVMSMFKREFIIAVLKACVCFCCIVILAKALAKDEWLTRKIDVKREVVFGTLKTTIEEIIGMIFFVLGMVLTATMVVYVFIVIGTGLRNEQFQKKPSFSAVETLKKLYHKENDFYRTNYFPQIKKLNLSAYEPCLNDKDGDCDPNKIIGIFSKETRKALAQIEWNLNEGLKKEFNAEGADFEGVFERLNVFKMYHFVKNHTFSESDLNMLKREINIQAGERLKRESETYYNGSWITRNLSEKEKQNFEAMCVIKDISVLTKEKIYQYLKWHTSSLRGKCLQDELNPMKILLK